MSTEGIKRVTNALLATMSETQKSNALIQRQEQIDAVLETMIGRPLSRHNPRNALSLPEFHDNPPDFLSIEAPPPYSQLKEMILHLESASKHAEAVYRDLLAIEKNSPQEHRKIDKLGRDLDMEKFDESTIVRVVGVSKAAMFSNLFMHAYTKRRANTLKELMRAHYPSGPGRKRKNVHAYLVAEKLARFYLKARKERPTFGTGDGGIPSTDYARALESILKILEMKASLRRPAEAAIAGITAEEINAANTRDKTLGELLMGSSF